MRLSVVATLYRSAPHMAEFVARADAAARAFAGNDYELVLVNDGSPDESLAIALRMAEANPRISVVDLSRNFGHHSAILAGLAESRGDLVLLIDSDLEEDPAWLALFHGIMSQGETDVVYGVQSQRKGGGFERVSGAVFWQVFKALTRIDVPANMVTARLMTRRYVDALLRHRERELFLAGLFHIAGFVQRSVTVGKLARGSSTYTLRRKVAMLVNAVTSFSSTPLYMIFYSGMFISAISALYIALLVFRWQFLDRPPTGWTSLIASVWLLGGLTISFLGIIGVYVAKIFSEVKQRPTIVRAIHRAGDREAGSRRLGAGAPGADADHS